MSREIKINSNYDFSSYITRSFFKNTRKFELFIRDIILFFLFNLLLLEFLLYVGIFINYNYNLQLQN